MGKTLVDRKHVKMAWGDYSFALRKWRFRRNRKVSNVYVQFGPFEMVVWYR